MIDLLIIGFMAFLIIILTMIFLFELNHKITNKSENFLNYNDLLAVTHEALDPDLKSLKSNKKVYYKKSKSSSNLMNENIRLNPEYEFIEINSEEDLDKLDSFIFIQGNLVLLVPLRRLTNMDLYVINKHVKLIKPKENFEKSDQKTDLNNSFEKSNQVDFTPENLEIIKSRDNFENLKSSDQDFSTFRGHKTNLQIEKRKEFYFITLNNQDIGYFFDNSNTYIVSRRRPKIELIPAPKFIPKQFDLDYAQKIPKNIVQTFKSNIYSTMRASIQRTVDLNPEYNYYYYDDDDCRRFISQNFKSKVLAAYDDLIPGAFKADFFRTCWLYINGGVYMDSGFYCNKAFREFIGPEETFIAPEDNFNNFKRSQSSLYNALMISVPRHPILKLHIEIMLDHIKNHVIYPSVLDITGPGALGKAADLYLKSERPLIGGHLYKDGIRTVQHDATFWKGKPNKRYNSGIHYDFNSIIKLNGRLLTTQYLFFRDERNAHKKENPSYGSLKNNKKSFYKSAR